jgi:hypothetical protein
MVKRICAGMAVLLVACWVAAFLFPHGPFVRRGVTPAAFDRIEHGMSQRHVEALLGPPDGEQMYVTGGYMQTWSGPDYVVVLSFGGEIGVVKGSLQKDATIIKKLPVGLPSW